MKQHRAAPEDQHTSAPPRARFAVVRNMRRPAALGLPELGALAIAAILLITTLAAYFLYLVPQRTRLDSLGQERARLEKRLRDAQDVDVRNTDARTTVTKIIDSLDKFETGTLADRNASSTAIIEELNDKTRRNGLARAQFSFMRQDEMTTEQLQQQQQRLATGGVDVSAARARNRQSVFPGIDISLTVEGSYAAVRHFVRDLETSRSFIVVNGVELESVTDASAARAAESSVARGQLVALRLDMSAYFRRAAVQLGDPATTTTGDRPAR